MREEWVNCAGERQDLRGCLDGVDDEFRSAWAHQPVEVEHGDWRGVFGKVLLW
ncbi:MAG: hypothetical protein FWF75_03840 [Propionibacteriaceae bacterium]|nr:hypothetical protein [Propionibacteriaceae bacterium]